jgi:hypothetical protein
MSTTNVHSVPKRRGRPPKKKPEVVASPSMKHSEAIPTSEPRGASKKDSTKKRPAAEMDSDSPRRSKRRKDTGRDHSSPVKSTNLRGHQMVDPVLSAQFAGLPTRNKPSAASADDEDLVAITHTQAQSGISTFDIPNPAESITIPVDSTSVPDASQQAHPNVRDSCSLT